MRLNHRLLAQGYYQGLGMADALAAIQVVDKLDKIGRDGVAQLLAAQGCADAQIESILALAGIRCTDDSFIAKVRALGVSNESVDQGLDELANLMATVSARFPGQIVVDLAVARGLDYYTGAVFEVELEGFPSLGTVAGGGRYDSLASDGKRTYPGVGISFGITRVLAPLIAQGALTASRTVPSAVLVAVDTEETRGDADAVAHQLRARGVACEVAPGAPAYGKQIRFAERRGIPFVWFGGVSGQVKDIRSGEQVEANASSWSPPEVDARPVVVR